MSTDRLTEYWYRYDDRQYAPPLDEYDNVCGEGRVEVTLTKFPIIKYTPKGAWIDLYGDKKFVLRTARKRYACPTKEEAKESFLARKAKQIRIYKAKIRRAELAITRIEHPTSRYPIQEFEGHGLTKISY